MRPAVAVFALLAAPTSAACSSSPPGATATPPSAPAPAAFKTRFATTKGDFVVEVTRAWAPHGADRFHSLVAAQYYDGVKFFRAIKGFMVQFGLNGQPEVTRRWATPIPDDPVTQSNLRGFVTFATAGPDTRTTQIFINLADNQRLDGGGFAPFGKVIAGMEVVDSLHTGAGESPDQGRIHSEGNAYLEREFPALDAVNTATIVP